jgi:uncharacterized protein
MLQVNVSQLLKEPVGSTRDIEVNGAVDITADGSTSEVQGDVRLTRTGRSILVKGRLCVSVEVDCARCLNPFGCPLVLDIEEEYFPVVDVASGNPLAPPDEPGFFTIDERQVIDLTEAVRQYALMAIPMKPLCREDCAGLS